MSGIFQSFFMYGGAAATYQSAAWRANSAYTSGTASVTLAFPTGYAANDILVAAIAGHNVGIPSQGQTNLTNNGWARVANSNTHLVGAATANVFLDIWYQRATTGAQTAVVIGDAGDHTLVVVAAFQGANVTGNPWDTGTAAGVNVSMTTASAQTTSGNVTTTFANNLIVSIMAHPRDIAGSAANASPLLINGSGDDTGLTERCDWGTVSGTGSGLVFFTHSKPSAGATANVRANTATAQTAIWWSGALKANLV